MIWKILIWILAWMPGIIIGYMIWQKHFPPISEIADVKAIQTVKPAWDIKTTYFCIWDCEDYGSQWWWSSRWWSSYGWWK